MTDTAVMPSSQSSSHDFSKAGFSILPWQKVVWDRMATCLHEKRLPHALLFSGIAGIGKKHFAKVFALALLCEALREDQTGCGVCRACQWVIAGTHPAIFSIAPESVNQAIRIDTIREMTEFVNASALVGQCKIIIIDMADKMNVFAANALLKSLEEPPANTYFILISANSQRLPATVRSRCQIVQFALPKTAEALFFLQQKTNETVSPAILQQALLFAAGAPCDALALIEKNELVLQQAFYQDMWSLSLSEKDPVHIAEKWSAKEYQEKIPLTRLLDWLYVWLKNMLAGRLTGFFSDAYFPAIPQTMTQHPIIKISQHDFFAYFNFLIESAGALKLSPQLNRQLFLESLLISWVERCA